MNNSSRNIELEKKIDTYIKGHLSQEQSDELWAQLLKRPDYIDYLKTQVDLARFYQSRGSGHLELLEVEEAGQDYESRKKFDWRWFSAAAAIIVAAVLTSVFLTNQQSSIRQWSNRQITLGENLASAPVTRGTGEIPTPDSLLNAGFKAAIDGNIKAATDIFHRAVKRYDIPKIDAKASLNLGILRYNDSKFRTSIQYFKRAVSNADNLALLKERAYWYMANAYINIGQLKDARKAVSEAHQIGKMYKSKESDLLKRLKLTLQNRNKEEPNRSK